MKRSIDKLRRGDVFYSRTVLDAPLSEEDYKEQRMKMHSRERVMAALRREVPDRVPLSSPLPAVESVFMEM